MTGHPRHLARPRAPFFGRRAGRAALFLGVVPLLAGADCIGNSDTGWTRFNGADQALTIPVGPDAPTEPASLTLTSTTGTVDVGTFTVTPGGGPVGTEHGVVVEVFDDYEETVGRVTLVTTGDRGTQKHFLVRDSADIGLWQLDVTSLGDEGETREDTFTLNLWRAATEDEEADPDGEVEE